jgi:hypothetical protein
MEAFLGPGEMKRPVRLDVVAEVSGPQLPARFCHRWGPAPPRPLHPGLAEVLAGSFHHTGGDRPPRPEGFGIAQVAPSAVEVASPCLHHLALLAAPAPPTAAAQTRTPGGRARMTGPPARAGDRPNDRLAMAGSPAPVDRQRPCPGAAGGTHRERRADRTGPPVGPGSFQQQPRARAPAGQGRWRLSSLMS